MISARWPRALIPILFILPATAADAAARQPDASDGRLGVFLDCEFFCDFDYLRRTIPYVNWLRERTAADVHLLVTRQPTGAGGNSYELFLIGLGGFAEREDTVRVATRQDDTDAEIREALARGITLGLVPFLMRTAVAPQLSLAFEATDTFDQPLQPTVDPWNFWVFRLRVGGSLEGESRSESSEIEGSVSANRITDAMKVELEADAEFNRDEFELSDGERLVSTARNVDIRALLVRSLGPHWSAGVRTSGGVSTRFNHDFVLRFGPAVEYSVFPYEESSRRQIAVLYTLETARFNYEEITLFEQLQETRVTQNLEVSAAFRQPWGEIDGSLEWSNYMHDLDLHRIDLFAGVEVRLFRGFSLDLRGNVARIKDQIYVPREGIPDEDILLRRRELGTDFEYEIDLGFIFSFGSVLNNVVNPRMR